MHAQLRNDFFNQNLPKSHLIKIKIASVKLGLSLQSLTLFSSIVVLTIDFFMRLSTKL